MQAATMSATEKRLLHRVSITPLLLILFSCFYFADVLLRASEKYFWYDEIFTVYFARVNPGSVWHLLQNGIDFNPPLFYWFTQASEAIFGETRIGVRLPEIVGFWIFSLCLFRFVNRGAGIAPGFIAMVFPMFTSAFFYAYEARPHGIVLGFAGLALLCWQMAQEGNRRSLWLTALSLSLFGAFMTHCYALLLLFPFALAELFQIAINRRVNVPNWVALIAPAILAVPIYIPLLQSEHRLSEGTPFETAFAPYWVRVGHFYTFLLGPSLLVILFALFSRPLARFASAAPRLKIPAKELVLAFGFLALPVAGVALGKVVHGPFFDRYFISALIGVCFYLAVMFGGLTSIVPRVIALGYATLLAIALLYGFSHVVWNRLHGVGELLREPSSGETLDTTPHKPLANESLLVSSAQDSVPVVIQDSLQFVYMAHYSPEIGRRLYYVAGSARYFFYRALRVWHGWGPECNPPEIYSQFLASHGRFYLYGGNEVIQSISELLRTGWQLRSLQTLNGHNLALVENTNPTQGSAPRSE